jgi:hypothetical protein
MIIIRNQGRGSYSFVKFHLGFLRFLIFLLPKLLVNCVIISFTPTTTQKLLRQIDDEILRFLGFECHGAQAGDGWPLKFPVYVDGNSWSFLISKIHITKF